MNKIDIWEFKHRILWRQIIVLSINHYNLKRFVVMNSLNKLVFNVGFHKSHAPMTLFLYNDQKNFLVTFFNNLSKV